MSGVSQGAPQSTNFSFGPSLIQQTNEQSGKYVSSDGVLFQTKASPSPFGAPVSSSSQSYYNQNDNYNGATNFGPSPYPSFGQFGVASAPGGGGPPDGGGNYGTVATGQGPPRDPFKALCAPDHVEPQPGRLLQLNGSEEDCYSYKALVAMTLQALPMTATACRNWETHLLGQMGGIDKTVDDFITRWTMEPLELKATDNRMIRVEWCYLTDI